MQLELINKKKFIYIYSILSIIIFIYNFIVNDYLTNNEFPGYITITFICIYLLNILFIKLKHLNNIYFFYSVKLLQLIIASLIIFGDLITTSYTALIMYILIVIEVISTVKIETKSLINKIYILLTIPLVITSIISCIEKRTFSPLFFTVQIIVVIIGIYMIYNSSTNALINQIEVQKKLWLEVKNKNKDLLASKKQTQLVHNQLVKQKNELEEANETLNKVTAEMYIQNELLSYISSVLDIEELMELVTDSILGAIGVDTCSIVIYDTINNTYHYKVKSTYETDYLLPFIEAMKEGKLDEYFILGEPYIDNQVTKGKYKFTYERAVGSLVIIPIIKDNNTYGLLIAEHKSSNMISENSIRFFQNIASQINIAINNANLYRKMEEMANRDALTYVYNRNYLRKVFNDLAEKVQTNNKSLSLALFDIDKFKKVNDTYGHLFGDQVLKIISNISEKYVNLNDGILGRYGGEEFLIIFPDKTLDEAYQIMKEIHNCIKNTKIPYNDKLIDINVSIGLTSYPEICKSPADLVKRADKAMYVSKETGRGRITIDNIDL